MTEAQVRDVVASNLSALDGNLILVGIEHQIKRAGSPKAQIDILAKDEFGCFTVIEIKKSNQTARSAIQQLYKYASLLKREYGLHPEKIRCIIVSTVWDELLAPFSEFKHFAGYDIQGFMLTLGPNGPSFSEVQASFEPGGYNPFPRYIFFEFCEAEYRDEVCHSLLTVLERLPSFNSVTLKMNYEGENSGICNPYGFAWVYFPGDQVAIEKELAAAGLAYRADADDENFDADAIDIDNEDHFYPQSELKRLETFEEYVWAVLDEIPDNDGRGEWNFFALHSLNNTLVDWVLKQSIPHGPMFRDERIFAEQDIVPLCCGFTGTHPYIFNMKTTPRRPPHFLFVRYGLQQFLRHNPHWKKAVDHVLSRIQEDEVIEIHVYNPLNFFGFLRDLALEGSELARLKRIPC